MVFVEHDLISCLDTFTHRDQPSSDIGTHDLESEIFPFPILERTLRDFGSFLRHLVARSTVVNLSWVLLHVEAVRNRTWNRRGACTRVHDEVCPLISLALGMWMGCPVNIVQTAHHQVLMIIFMFDTALVAKPTALTQLTGAMLRVADRSLASVFASLVSYLSVWSSDLLPPSSRTLACSNFSAGVLHMH